MFVPFSDYVANRRTERQTNCPLCSSSFVESRIGNFKAQVECWACSRKRWISEDPCLECGLRNYEASRLAWKISLSVHLPEKLGDARWIMDLDELEMELEVHNRKARGEGLRGGLRVVMKV